MKDRVPTPGKEGRVRLRQDNGQILEGVLEMADEPLEIGTPLTKATLLQDATAAILGLTGDPTVNDALLALIVTSGGFCMVRVQVYEAGTETPVPGVLISGLTTLAGGDLYADGNGYAVGKTTSASTMIRVSPDYADLTSEERTFDTPAGKIVDITLYVIRVSNPNGIEVELSESRTVLFTERVAPIDVHVVGAGDGGSTGSAYYESGRFKRDSQYAGNGGKSGGQLYRTNVGITPHKKYQAIVGAGGQPLPERTVHASDNYYSMGDESSNKGGVSSFVGVSSEQGESKPGGSGAYYSYDSSLDRETSGESEQGGTLTLKKFGTGADVTTSSGGGGGIQKPNLSTGSPGGSPGGGNGGNSGASGTDATTPGSGGGGGSVEADSLSAKAYPSGAGYRGVIYYRWRYK